MSRPVPRACVVAGRLALGLALSGVGCASRGAVAPVIPGESVRLDRGVAVVLPDRSTLEYQGLGADSRCPPGAHCVHAGSVELRFLHSPARGGTRTVSLEPPVRNAAQLDTRWRLELVDPGTVAATAVTVRIRPRP